MSAVFFFFNDTATTEIYTLSLHDALPISRKCAGKRSSAAWPRPSARERRPPRGDRKSTRLNSSHQIISYAVFCLKKKKKPENKDNTTRQLHQRTTTTKAIRPTHIRAAEVP